MGKIIKTGMTARIDLKDGIDAVVDTVKITIGPKGRNVKTSKGTFNDGGLISEDLSFSGKTKQMGASMAKNVIKQTSDMVGGGRTASAILFQAIIEEGQKYVETGANVVHLNTGIKNAVKDVIERLKGMSTPVKTQEQLEHVATISTENKELGKVIAEVVYKIGKDGVVNIEDGNTFGIKTEYVEGLKFEKGYVSPWMSNNPMSPNPEDNTKAELSDMDIWITDRKITSFKQLIPLVAEENKKIRDKILVIAEDFEGDTIDMAIQMRLRQGIHIILVKLPGFGDDKKGWLQDIAGMTGIDLTNEKSIGFAKKIVVTEKSTSIIEGRAGEYAKRLKAQMEAEENKYIKEKLIQRVANVTSGVAMIKVGAASNEELKYLKKKIEDGVSEAKRALEEGIIPGGDVAFVNAVKMLKYKKENTDEAYGYNVILDAVEAPLKQIIKNANGQKEVVINKIKESKSNTIGYDALNDEVTDVMERGIIDATKVARTALENAASEAGMFLTIEKVIVDEDEITK